MTATSSRGGHTYAESTVVQSPSRMVGALGVNVGGVVRNESEDRARIRKRLFRVDGENALQDLSPLL